MTFYDTKYFMCSNYFAADGTNDKCPILVKNEIDPCLFTALDDLEHNCSDRSCIRANTVRDSDVNKGTEHAHLRGFSYRDTYTSLSVSFDLSVITFSYDL